ncbi:MAG: riboflavin synthase [Bdellovibrionales bacterium]|nr:riboflavin synthase [Bdellovibrionales bacterium]
MFSGIVEETGRVSQVDPVDQGSRLQIFSRLDFSSSANGDSICVEGVCLTLVEKSSSDDGWLLSFDIASETLRVTTLGALQEGDLVHLERSLVIGDRLHGHFVTGHVDTVATVMEVLEEGETTKVRLGFPSVSLPSASRLVAPKGSITIAGVSLTVGEVEGDSFCVYLIPHTKEVTRFGALRENDHVNIEFDILARYVQQNYQGA